MALSLSAWNLIRSMKTVDQWGSTINANIIGSQRVGFKSNTITFGGGVTQVVKPTNIAAGVQVAEQQVSVANTQINWQQGELVETNKVSDFAIQGDGFFMVYDPKDKQIYYTRDGQFNDNGTGQLVNSQGLLAIDQAAAINLGLQGTANFPYTAPTAFTAAQIASGDTDWSPLTTPAGSNPTYPYWLANAGGVGDYSVKVKKTFFLGNAPSAPVNFTIGVDNTAFVYVNGQLVTNASYPNGKVTLGTSPAMFDISKYLQQGANTIQILASNDPPVGAGNPAGLLTTGSIPGGAPDGTTVDFSSAGGNWAIKAIPFPAFTSAPDETKLQVQPKDLLLADTSKKEQLKFSKYGSTIYEALFPGSDFTIGLPDTNNLGRSLWNNLEASNVSVDKQAAELSASEKYFDTLTKQFLVYISNIDSSLSLFK